MADLRNGTQRGDLEVMKALPFFVSTAISTLLQVLYSGLVTITSYFLLGPLLEDIDSLLNMPNPNMIGFLPIISCLGIILAPFVHAGTGMLYAILHRREGNLSHEEGTIGGAVSAGTARFLYGILNGILSLALYPILLSSFNQALPQIPPGSGLFSPFAVLPSIAGGLINACFGTAIAAGIGALGGLLGSAIMQGSQDE